MNNNYLYLQILPAILNDTVEVKANLAAGYYSPDNDDIYQYLYIDVDNLSHILIMHLKPLYEGLFSYLYKFIEDKVPTGITKAEIYFEIRETINLLFQIRLYLYGTQDTVLEEDVTNLLLDLHGYITDEELDWLLQDLFPDYHGQNEPTSLNPFYNLRS